MQLVIDIDEYDYEKVKELVSDGVFDYEGTTAHLFKSVVNGTPLPKEHGGNLENNGRLERIDGECGNQKKIREKYIAVKQSDFEDNGDTFKAIKDGFGLPPLGYKYVKIKG